MKFIDLETQQKLIRTNIDAAISRVLSHGNYIMGEEVIKFENDLKKFTNSKFATTCANGTDALSIVLMAWKVKPGDVVFVPSFTYVSSAETIAQIGAIPFFVDVSLDTFNICPESLKEGIVQAKKKGMNCVAVIPVDLFGQTNDIDKISAIAAEENLKVLIDSAQSFGAENCERRVGTMGDATTTSFFPAKPLGCYGDGGAIFVQNEELNNQINSIRLHGKGNHKYEHSCIGVNSRLDTLQAAILIEKLKIFPDEIKLREKVANQYLNNLTNLVMLPKVEQCYKSVWAQFTLRSNYRNELQNFLTDNGIPSNIYYPKPLHMQPGYRHYPKLENGCSNSLTLSNQVLSLPMNPYLKSEDINHISEKINQFAKSKNETTI